MRHQPKHRGKSKFRPCSACEGAGEVWIAGKAVECRACKGTGRARNK